MHLPARALLLVAAAVPVAARDARGQSPITRASVDSNGVEGNSESGTFLPGTHQGPSIAISGDGRFVAFQSYASNLVPDDANLQPDIFVHDLATGATTRVSVDLGGGDANHASRSPALSRDGRFVVFCSDATDLIDDDANIYQDVYLRDRDPDGNGLFDEGNGTTERISVDAGGGDSDGPSYFPAISADGRVIAFASDATDLVAGDASGWTDLFVRDRGTGVTTRVNVAPDGSEADHAAGSPCLSADGNLVAFHTSASNLVPGDTNGATDVFVRDLATGTTALVSRHLRGGTKSASEPAISADGRYVAFSSTGDDFVDGDANGWNDVFRHELATGETVRVSLGPAGQEGDADSRDPALSADGAIVAFSSLARNFAPLDVNQRSDIFWRDCASGEAHCASSDLVGIAADERSEVVALSEDGQRVVFVSRAIGLVPGDGNFEVDVFVFDRAAMIDAAWSSYGDGTAGTLGVPAFSAQAPPEFGTTLALDLGNSLGQWTVAFLAAGFGEASLPIAGGTLLVDPVAMQLLLLPIAPPGSTFEADIPYDVGLHGVSVWAQLLVYDAGAPKGLSFSTGMRLDFGR